METSLHRDLKSFYAGDDARTEVRVGRFRIDAIAGDVLIEIQHSALTAIRDKIAALCKQHQVLVVKPLVASKLLVKRAKKGGKVVDRRRSPKQGQILDAFDELIHFTRVFPHNNLTLELALVDVEEWRYPGHGRRWRRRRNDFQVEDQKLLNVRDRRRVADAADLWTLLPQIDLPQPFHTQHLAQQLGVDRWVAQRIAYVLRETGAVQQVGKRGNALLYSIPDPIPDSIPDVPARTGHSKAA
jgi:hypothetical protein